MTNFITELTEGRVFKDGASVRGKSAKSIADIVYLMFLTLEVIRHINKEAAVNYTNQLLKWQEFNSMKNSATDMYNLISVLDNQDLYDLYIDVDHAIAIPTFQLFRYMRDLVRNTNSHSIDRQFLIALENFLKVTEYKNYRRVVGDWVTSTQSEKNGTIVMLKRELNSKVPQADIFMLFKSLVN